MIIFAGSCSTPGAIYYLQSLAAFSSRMPLSENSLEASLSSIVTGIAFWLPGKLTFGDYINTSFTGYSAKLIIAIALTPLIYLGHAMIHSYLGKEQSEQMVEETAKQP